VLIPIGGLFLRRGLARSDRPGPGRRHPAPCARRDSVPCARPGSRPCALLRAAVSLFPLLFPFILLAALLPAPLHSRTLHVPADFSTIRAAVRAAASGDIVEVEDGIYLEDDIIIDKNIRVAARHAFGATIYGTELRTSAVFVVRAAAEIEGFVIKNAGIGILQRDSPDVEWTGRDLAFLNIETAAVSLNDRNSATGRATLSDIIVDRSDVAFETNDARGIRISGAVVTNCGTAFAGYDHFYFDVDRAVICDCRSLTNHPSYAPKPPATNAISLGTDVVSLDSPEAVRIPAGGFEALLFRFFPAVPAPTPDRGPDERRRFLDWFSAVILGEISLGRGEGPVARAAYAEALRDAEAAGSEELAFRALCGLGRAAEKRQQPAEALGYYERAIQSVKRLRNALPVRIYQEGFFEDKFEAYDAAVSLLYRLHREQPAEGFDRRALRYVEEWKAGGFLESLRRLRADLKAGLTDESRRSEESASRAISRIQARLEDDALPPSEIEGWSVKLVQAEKDFNNVLSQIRREKARGVAPPEARPEERLETRMAPDTAVFIYTCGEEETYAFALAAGGLRFVRIGRTRELRPLVENYLAFLQLDPGRGFKGAAGGRRLCRLLLSPLLDNIGRGVTKLVIIPDGALCYLPFEALVVDEGGDGAPPSRASGGRARFLSEDFEVAYAPSLSCLMGVSTMKTGGAAKLDLLGVADEEARVIRGLAPNLSYRFPRLSYASEEVREIARSFDPRRSKLLIDAEAQETAFKRLPLSDYRIIHLATHGFFNDERWWRSALLLRRTPALDDDGLLQPLELCRLDLDADLVVLSACRTGTGRFSRGEGILGLSGAIMAAGARSVISSLWTVNDKSTAALMTRLYRYLEEGKTKAGALRQAKLEMLGTAYAHPFFWASFILSGDYDTAIPLEKRAP
jgi:CHAT domain-containing protein